MARRDARRGPCHAHDKAECCGRDICSDCDIPDHCPTHDQENAA